MKKFFAVFVALVLILSLCGCKERTEFDTSLPSTSASTSQSSESTPQSSESTSQSSESAPKSSESAPKSSESAPKSSESAPKSSESAPKSSESAPKSSESAPQSSESTPQSSESTSQPSTSTPVEVDNALQKYYDEMIANYFEYTSTTTMIGTPEGALKVVATQTAGLKKFAEMTVPEEYAERHSAMISASEEDNKWRALVTDFGNGVIDREGFNKKVLELYPNGYRSSFTTACLNIVAQLNHEPTVVPTEKGNLLEMLSKF